MTEPRFDQQPPSRHVATPGTWPPGTIANFTPTWVPMQHVGGINHGHTFDVPAELEEVVYTIEDPWDLDTLRANPGRSPFRSSTYRRAGDVMVVHYPPTSSDPSPFPTFHLFRRKAHQ
jgi:hypothetical protein